MNSFKSYLMLTTSLKGGGGKSTFACTLLDNLEGSHQALQRARQLQKEYHHFHAEWTRLQPKAQHESAKADESRTQKPVPSQVQGTKPCPEVEPKRNPDTIGAIEAEWQRLSVPSGPARADAPPNAEPRRSPDGVGGSSQ